MSSLRARLRPAPPVNIFLEELPPARRPMAAAGNGSERSALAASAAGSIRRFEKALSDAARAILVPFGRPPLH